MKLLFIAETLKFGGGERHTVGLARALQRRGHAVTVASLKNQDELADELCAAGVALLHCHSRGALDWSALRRLAAHLRDARPDVLVATSQYSLMYAVLARALVRRGRAGLPQLAFISHSMDVVRRSRRERLRFMVYQRFYRLADCVVFVSALQQRFFASLGVRPRRMELIHSGLDLSHFDADAVAGQGALLRRTLGFGDDELVIGLCAVFRDEKRHVDLLHALARLRDNGVPARVLLVGDGPLRAHIAFHRDQLGLADAVVMAGFQQDVRPYIAACDVMTLTSHAETFPIATLEYMALGKALVASEVGGVCEQIEHGVNGLLYPAGDIASLSDALALCCDRTRRAALGQGALATVRARFDADLMTQRYERLFASLCNVSIAARGDPEEPWVTPT
jgi:glycosyltransferase involved in cell wall biosynthesis